MGGFIFILGGGVPHGGASVLVWGGGGSQKNCKMGGGTLPTMGNPEICYLS